MELNETQRQRRGHNFLPPQADRKRVPALGSTDGQGMDATVHLHYFVGSADWYITEMDWDTLEGFGWAELIPGGGELGYISLADLEPLSVRRVFVVERDMNWVPESLGNVLAERA